MHYTDEQAIPGTTLGVISVMQKVMQHGEANDRKCKLDAYNRLRRINWRLRFVFFKIIAVCTKQTTNVAFWLVQAFELTSIPSKAGSTRV